MPRQSEINTEEVNEMAGIVDFDAAQLEDLVNRLGVRRAWLSIIATSLRGRDELAYILQCPEFADAEMLDRNLIEDLSIGEISVLYEYSVTSHDADSRKSNGQFFTPDDVADFMAGFESKFPDGRWLDPCSGIGNLSWHLVAKQQNPEEFLATRMTLSDTDDLALLIARTLLTATFQSKRAQLFHDIEPNFVRFDFLAVSANGNENLFGSNLELDRIPDHDFVIMNPPYLAGTQDSRFETAKAADLYAYFLENVIKTSRGFISITPQSFTNARKFSQLRALLLRHYANLTIFNFDNIPGNIFRGIKFGSRNTNTANSIRVAITVAIPGDGQRRITSLMRWRSAERGRLFEEVEQFLSTAPLSDEYFPKVSVVFEELYRQLSMTRTLSSLCSRRVTEYPLYVPSAPRYFIPALKSAAQRASQRVVYFTTSEDRDLAYLVINSSLMYWWWRVRDGGMTLSQETLLSLPIPEFSVDPGFVAMLEDSETVNKVYKQNAGSAQENVKHPASLVLQLNQLVMPEFADRLLSTHENSEFVQTEFLPIDNSQPCSAMADGVIDLRQPLVVAVPATA